MALNGIDISSWQAGIDLSVVPCDFVIIKATQGTGYTNHDYARAYSQAKAAGKCLGVYHYAEGGSPTAEADYFINRVGSRIGECILVLDWEGEQNPAFGVNDFAWCKAWLDHVANKTGVRPMLYISQSIMGRFNGIGNYGLWIAQYADMNTTGYQATPWNEGAYYCAMRQYSSCGRLSGYAGNLDLNKFYGDRAAWSRYAGNGNATSSDIGTQVNSNGMFYRAHCSNIGWLDSVRDGQTAGTTGRGIAMEAFKITPPEGMVIDVKAHIQDVGWKTYSGVKRGKSSGEGSSKNDPIIGSVGNARRLEAFELCIVENPKKMKVRYRAHIQNHGWTGWVDAGYAVGTVGCSLAIEAIQIKAV